MYVAETEVSLSKLLTCIVEFNVGAIEASTAVTKGHRAVNSLRAFDAERSQQRDGKRHAGWVKAGCLLMAQAKRWSAKNPAEDLLGTGSSAFCQQLLCCSSARAAKNPNWHSLYNAE